MTLSEKRIQFVIERLGLKHVFVRRHSENSETCLAFNFLAFYVISMTGNSYLNAYHEVGHIFLWQHKKIQSKYTSMFLKSNCVRSFVTEYAQTSVHEDFADTFSFVMMDLFEGRKYKKNLGGMALKKYCFIEKAVKEILS